MLWIRCNTVDASNDDGATFDASCKLCLAMDVAEVDDVEADAESHELELELEMELELELDGEKASVPHV
jgi:hypothetical protein